MDSDSHPGDAPVHRITWAVREEGFNCWEDDHSLVLVSDLYFRYHVPSLQSFLFIIILFIFNLFTYFFIEVQLTY